MKNTLKKLLSLSLAVILAFGLIACSGGNDSALQKYVDEKGPEFVDQFETSFAAGSGGIGCECVLTVNGTALTVDVLVDGFDNVPEATKTQMQNLYDTQKSTLKTGFQEIKDEVPELSKAIMNICEEDGDVIASVDIDF